MIRDIASAATSLVATPHGILRPDRDIENVHKPPRVCERRLPLERVSMRRLLSSLMFTVAVLLAPTLVAQDTATLPKGMDVLTKYRNVTGGKAAYEAIKTMQFEGTVSIPEAGIQGKLVMHYSKPDKLAAEVTIEGIGVTRQGVNGKIAWEISPMTGARLIEGVEANRLIESPSMPRDPRAGEDLREVERHRRRGRQRRGVFSSRRQAVRFGQAHDCVLFPEGWSAAKVDRLRSHSVLGK